MTQKPMSERDKRLFDAYELVRNPLAATDYRTMSKRLRAHHTILELGMIGSGEIARQAQMAEALADICLGLAIRLERAG